jgi:type VI secretion system protein ImpH
VAGPDRAQEAAVTLPAILNREPWRSDFFDAMRRIEASYPELPRLGTSVRPADEPIRLGQPAARAAATAAIAALIGDRRAADGDALPPKLLVNFLGLFGPNGALPLEYTEYAIRRQRHEKDPVLPEFADVFHHRMLLLFYRTWAEAEPVVGLDRDDDRFGGWIAALIGIGAPSLRARDDMPDAAKLFFSGRLAQHARNAEGLEVIVSAVAGLPAEVEELVGDWLDIPVPLRTRLSGGPDGGALGRGATLGARVYEVQHRFRIRLGPMSLDDYHRLLPGTRGLARLRAAVRNYVGDEFGWDLQLVLQGSAVPDLAVGSAGRLGRTAWLGQRSTLADAADLILDSDYFGPPLPGPDPIGVTA